MDLEIGWQRPQNQIFILLQHALLRHPTLPQFAGSLSRLSEARPVPTMPSSAIITSANAIRWLEGWLEGICFG